MESVTIRLLAVISFAYYFEIIFKSLHILTATVKICYLFRIW